MFKKINEAYQILSDPTLRTRYDTMGKEAATPEGGFMNAKDFFRQMFGGEKFVNLIGEISLGNILNDMMTNTTQEGSSTADSASVSTPGRKQGTGASYSLTKEQQAELDRLHKERVDMLVGHLIQRTNYYTQGIYSASQFEDMIRKEALDLAKESYGVPLLHSIGYVYSSKARQALGDYKWFGLPGLMHSVKEKGHIVASVFDTIGAVRQATNSTPQGANGSQASNPNSNDPGYNVPTPEQEEKIKNALWKTSNLEVESTLRAVCEKFLKVPSKTEREIRARALKMIGKIYCGIQETQS
jgi:curved DNA-binding protein CbpA